MIPDSLVEKAEEYVDSGAYFTDLSAMVAYPTESNAAGRSRCH